MENRKINIEDLKRSLQEQFKSIEDFDEKHLEEIKNKLNDHFNNQDRVHIDNVGDFEIKDREGNETLVFSSISKNAHASNLRGRSLHEVWRQRRGREKKETASKLSKWAFYLIILVILMVIIIIFDLI